MTLSEELVWRNQIKDRTFSDLTYLDNPKTFYLGVDCSAPSMTIGNLAIFMTARRLLDAGWNTVLLVGGATSLIGDPGGKDEERQLKSREEIQDNVRAIAAQVNNLFSGQKYTLVDNYDWFKDIGYLEFLRDIGKHYSMTELVQRDYIANRIGEGGGGISYAEFSYNLIQGYDFWHLYKNHDVVLQIGGSDQWGNMLSGVPLIRKKENAEVNAMSAPLVINKATGKKFGKSEGGAIWLDPEMTSPYKFYQFWLNADDEGVEDYLKVYTLKSQIEIEEVLQEFKSDQSRRFAQKTLAYDVTSLVHGMERAESVKKISEVLFGDRNYDELNEKDYLELSKEIGLQEVHKDSDLADVLVNTSLASSKSEARRFMASGAIYINNEPIGTATSIDLNQTNHGYAVLRRGKNTQTIIKLA
jgi:tyrosyl-tRNA synthetase